MSRVWVTSDLHLGHDLAAQKRGFRGHDATRDHDDWVLAMLEAHVGRKDKLFVLGDVAFSAAGFTRVPEIPGAVKVLIGGNHDRRRAGDYIAMGFHDVAAMYTKRHLILTHIPIHPQEMVRWRINIHGHLHRGGVTSHAVGSPRYLNVNIELHGAPLGLDILHELADETP